MDTSQAGSALTSKADAANIAGEKLHKNLIRILPGLIDPAKQGFVPEHEGIDRGKNYDS